MNNDNIFVDLVTRLLLLTNVAQPHGANFLALALLSIFGEILD